MVKYKIIRGGEMSNPIQIMQKLEQAIQALEQGNIQLKSLGV